LSLVVIVTAVEDAVLLVVRSAVQLCKRAGLEIKKCDLAL